MKKTLALFAAALLLFPACRECSGWNYYQICDTGERWTYQSDILIKDRRFLPSCSDTAKIYIIGYDLECNDVLIDSL